MASLTLQKAEPLVIIMMFDSHSHLIDDSCGHKKKKLFFKQVCHMFKIFFDFSMTVALNQHNPYIKKPLFPVGGKKKHCIENYKSICPTLNM